MKVIFWGSSSYFSVPFLEDLINNKNIKVSYVITQPDKPSGRGLKIKPSLIKILSEKNNIKVLTPESLESDEILSIIKDIDFSIVVSYGKIIPEKIIKLHKYGMLNIHFSLLPKYRGAAPVQWCLMNGDSVTGVTIFWLDEGMDTGDIFLQEQETVTIQDDFYSLSERLIRKAKGLLYETIIRILSNQIIRIPQQGHPTYAPLLKKSDGIINWNFDAWKIHNIVRALVSWPKASTKLEFNNKILNVKILQTIPWEEKFNSNEKISCGTIIEVAKDFILVLCGNNSILKVLKLQPENKNPITAAQFICGYRVKKFDRFI
ncbi:MAG: methionyl-tRNA formyltransferase [Endomicrobiia bacterium]